ncbi:hypothetical protein ATB53_17340 [Xanthomonas translucens]|uniref:Uncharacterized protein n=2 Tax=Xanthomonas campestris pv. translucens TaxID=343 RepID=A0A109HI90_XANCT|nr:hypothetical protein ATB54_18070 [Xanthomonas translucens]KWV12646.1 hypothetical protein ATB53_17340 [Xanthomonas translucens]CCP40082.1 hypothetical protein BN444_01805 [Xanthomonas translucens pv. translucens DSM 18974]SCB02912.1 unnamed protein product [Xanthomonas translucens pv. translucens DSM 18974]
MRWFWTCRVGSVLLLARIVAADQAAQARTRFACLLDKLLNAAGVADVNSSFVLRTVKDFTGLPLPRG